MDKHPGGRPSKYDPKYCDTILELGKQGKNRTQMAASIGVDRTTLDYWAQCFPEFSAALKNADTIGEATHWDMLDDWLKTNKPGNLGAAIFKMCNSYKHLRRNDPKEASEDEGLEKPGITIAKDDAP